MGGPTGNWGTEKSRSRVYPHLLLLFVRSTGSHLLRDCTPSGDCISCSRQTACCGSIFCRLVLASGLCPPSAPRPLRPRAGTEQKKPVKTYLLCDSIYVKFKNRQHSSLVTGISLQEASGGVNRKGQEVVGVVSALIEVRVTRVCA